MNTINRSYSNEGLRAPKYGKPHLKKIYGWWRVSPYSSTWQGYINQQLWNKAHNFALMLNESLAFGGLR